MKISIIVPVYNVEKYLRKCLDSIVNQCFDDYEIICVNDGSLDNSQAIIDEYKMKYSNIVSIIQENKGIGGARNTGMNAAKGEYFLFVDSDDYLAPNALNILYTKAQETNCDIVWFKAQLVDVQGNVYPDDDNDNNNGISIISWNKLYRTGFVTIRFIEHIIFEDLNFTQKIIRLNPNITYIQDKLYYYVQREGSIVHSSNPSKSLDALISMDELITWLKENNLYNENEIQEMIFKEILFTRCSYVLSLNHPDSFKAYHAIIAYCHSRLKGFKKKPFYKKINRKAKIITSLYWYRLGFIFKLYHTIKYH